MRKLLTLLLFCFFIGSAQGQLIPGVVASSVQAEESPLMENLLAYWKLDETTGTTLYDEESNKNITTNGTINQTGILGKAVDIGSGQHIQLTYDATVNFNQSAWSFSFWYNPDNNANTLGHNVYLLYVRTTTGYTVRFLQISSNNYLNIIVKNSSASEYYSDSDQAFAGTGSWYHIVLVFRGDGYQTQIWVNGSNHTAGYSPTFSGTIGTQDDYAVYGNGVINGTSLFMDGRLDEIGLWARALTSDEIATLYNSGSGLTHPFQ